MVRKMKMNTVSVYEPKIKRTSIGRGKVKMSSMNKNKRANYKKYRGQGGWQIVAPKKSLFIGHFFAKIIQYNPWQHTPNLSQ